MTKSKTTSPFEAFLEQAQQNNMDIMELLSAGELLTPEQQIELYETWIKHSDSPVRYAAYFNLAVILDQQKMPEQAEQAYRDAIEIHPDFIQGQFNLG
jgi:tetratricopeptide (TPR) repeat protein